jgi:predicted amidohydrolase
MDKPIAAVIQHKLIVTKSLDELVAYYHRFLRVAKTKGSKLVVFPEYSGLGVGIPVFPGWRNSLLKEAATPKSGLFPKIKGMLAGSAANMVRADLQKSLRMTLEEMPESLYDVYVNVYSELARQYEVTMVAGSLYTYDEETETIRHGAYVFGPDGELLGRQLQVVPDPKTLELVTPGEGWQPIDTPVGRLGILFGYEALYPEPARVLAYQAADMLITIAATQRPATYRKIRQGALARCQENQLYGLVSFLIGPNPFASEEEPVFMGKSAIFAPLDFTPRFTGIMTELGSAQAEGVITAEWDFPALQELWRTSDTPLRREMPLEQVGLLAQVYGRSLTLADSTQKPEAQEPAPDQEAPETLPAVAEPVAEDETGEDILSVVTPILPTELPVARAELEEAVLPEPAAETSTEEEPAPEIPSPDTENADTEPADETSSEPVTESADDDETDAETPPPTAD